MYTEKMKSSIILSSLLLAFLIFAVQARNILQSGNEFPQGLVIGGENATCSDESDKGTLRFVDDSLDICQWPGEMAPWVSVSDLHGVVSNLTARVETLETSGNSCSSCSGGGSGGDGECTCDLKKMQSIVMCNYHGEYQTATFTCNCHASNSLGYWDSSSRCSTCAEGWTGATCQTDVDECGTNVHTCDANAQCSNTDGSYDCECSAGWSGDGYSCVDIDECLDTEVCHVNATCSNSAGSYACTCLPGFVGTGENVEGGCEYAPPGDQPESAAASCLEIYNYYDALGITIETGVFYIVGPSSTVVEVLCDMDNGGWLLFLKYSTSSSYPTDGNAWSSNPMTDLSVSGPSKHSDAFINFIPWTQYKDEIPGDPARSIISQGGKFTVQWGARYLSLPSGSTINGRNMQWCYENVPAFGTQCSTLSNTNTYSVSPHEGGQGGHWIHNVPAGTGGFSCGFGGSAETSCTIGSYTIFQWVR